MVLVLHDPGLHLHLRYQFSSAEVMCIGYGFGIFLQSGTYESLLQLRTAEVKNSYILGTAKTRIPWGCRHIPAIGSLLPYEVALEQSLQLSETRNYL